MVPDNGRQLGDIVVDGTGDDTTEIVGREDPVIDASQCENDETRKEEDSLGSSCTS